MVSMWYSFAVVHGKTIKDVEVGSSVTYIHV